MVADSGPEVVDVHVGGLHEVVEPVEPASHVGELRLDGLQPLALLARHTVHLLVHDLHQGADVGVGEDVGSNLPNHHLLETPGGEPGGIAGFLSPPHKGLADVVGELAALGIPAGERPIARLALDHSAEQEGASDPSRVPDLGGAAAQLSSDALELGLGDDGGKRLLHAHRVAPVLGVHAPQESPRVSLVDEHLVNAGLAPELPAGAGDAVVVEGAGDVHHPATGLGHVEDALDDGGRIRVELQCGALLGPVLHHELAVAVGHLAAHPEAARGGLSHSPQDLLGQILAVELVHALDDALKQPAGGRVLGLLGDGHHADALASEHGLEGDGVLALAGEPRKFPDEDFLEGGLGLGGLIQHLAKLGAVRDATALGLVHVLPDDHVAVLLGVVPERPELCGHGVVHVLPFAGDPGVEGHRGVVVSVVHLLLLPVSSCSVWRERRICVLSCLRHSLSSR